MIISSHGHMWEQEKLDSWLSLFSLLFRPREKRKEKNPFPLRLILSHFDSRHESIGEKGLISYKLFEWKKGAAESTYIATIPTPCRVYKEPPLQITITRKDKMEIEEEASMWPLPLTIFRLLSFGILGTPVFRGHECPTCAFDICGKDKNWNDIFLEVGCTVHLFVLSRNSLNIEAISESMKNAGFLSFTLRRKKKYVK